MVVLSYWFSKLGGIVDYANLLLDLALFDLCRSVVAPTLSF